MNNPLSALRNLIERIDSLPEEPDIVGGEEAWDGLLDSEELAEAREVIDGADPN